MWDHRCNECAGAKIAVGEGEPCNYCDAKPNTRAETRATLHASGMMSRAARPGLLRGAVMADPTSAVAGGLLAKLLPASIGAGLMVLVDPPQNKRELFVRLFAGLAMSFLLTSTTIDAMHSIAWLSFMDRQNPEHVVSVAGMWGVLGWFVIGGLRTWGKKFRADPAAAVKDAAP